VYGSAGARAPERRASWDRGFYAGHQCRRSPRIDGPASPVTLIPDRNGVVGRRMLPIASRQRRSPPTPLLSQAPGACASALGVLFGNDVQHRSRPHEKGRPKAPQVFHQETRRWGNDRPPAALSTMQDACQRKVAATHLCHRLTPTRCSREMNSARVRNLVAPRTLGSRLAPVRPVLGGVFLFQTAAPSAAVNRPATKSELSPDTPRTSQGLQKHVCFVHDRAM
jgi:hypothetical protein